MLAFILLVVFAALWYLFLPSVDGLKHSGDMVIKAKKKLDETK